MSIPKCALSYRYLIISIYILSSCSSQRIDLTGTVSTLANFQTRHNNLLNDEQELSVECSYNSSQSVGNSSGLRPSRDLVSNISSVINSSHYSDVFKPVERINGQSSPFETVSGKSSSHLESHQNVSQLNRSTLNKRTALQKRNSGDKISLHPSPTTENVNSSNSASSVESKLPRDESHFRNTSYRFCGVLDVQNSSLHQRVKRYVLEGSKWEKLEVTWAIVKKTESSTISHNQVMHDLYQAFKLWSDVSKLKFVEVHPETPKIDIAVGFYTLDHRDRYPFDGPGGTLAHAFYPGSGGDVHFDDQEVFMRHSEAIGSTSGTSFLVTAAHELGHSLGLQHSNEHTALMAPYYQSYPETFELPDDDRRAIQALYGVPDSGLNPYRPQFTTPDTTTTTSTSTTPTTTTTTREPNQPPVVPRTTVPTTVPNQGSCKPKSTGLEIPDACSTSFDAITYFRGELYFFKDKFLWRLPMLTSEYPSELERLGLEAFSGLEKIDAAFETPNGKSLVIFSGEKFIKTTLHRNTESIEKGKLVDLGIKNVSKIDAAMIWGRNGYAYLFSGDLYWRLGSDGKVENDYPRPMDVWRGVPYNISAAVSVGVKTYFFYERTFWPFDNQKMSVVDPPRLISSFFFDCPYPVHEERQIC